MLKVILVGLTLLTSCTNDQPWGRGEGRVVRLPCGQKVISANHDHSALVVAVRPFLPGELPVTVTIMYEGRVEYKIVECAK
ncbi:MAG: hypothetical protein WC505_05985 [Patescibacteria group bacterium]